MEKARILKFNLSAGLFDRKRTLRLAPGYLEYEAKYLEPGQLTRIDKEAILDIKFNMNWIIWYRFYVGCDFRIDVKTRENGIFRIKFVSYFDKNTAYIRAYNKIVNWMWEHYLRSIIDTYLQDFYQAHELELRNFRITDEGVYFINKDHLAYWEEVGVKEYEDYFAIFNQGYPELNERVPFDEWESEILLGVVEALKEKKFNENK
ncbi:hypothetical protein ACFS7Z_07940 [Pontibacter toksunensis]|uniref:Uncharacterized protein n=1 Tax=Pontibacter toksunensis TaxID=1332631 RepID=A0ABW6BW96_9BACT